MPGDETPREVALAREVERAVRKANAAVARVSELGTGLEEVTSRVSELDAMLGGLAQDVAGVVGEGGPVRSWILAAGPEAARATVVDLAEWLERVYLRYPDTRLPACWMWHPAVVEELLTLRHLHADAYRGKSATKVGEWHDRWLPGARGRISHDAGTCKLDNHQLGQSKGRPAAVTPMVQHLDAVVDAWMSTGLPPLPTKSQLDDAHEHQQMIFNPPVS